MKASEKGIIDIELGYNNSTGIYHINFTHHNCNIYVHFCNISLLLADSKISIFVTYAFATAYWNMLSKQYISYL